MSKKNRIEISRDVAAVTLFKSDRTCCVCRQRGKPIQIHHIDDNPANNTLENLAVVCFDCHNDTQTKGGFGRKLDALQVRQYWTDWTVRVEGRRDRADEIAGEHQSASKTASVVVERRDQLPDPRRIANYLQTLPAIRKDVYRRAQALWDTGVTSKMRQGNYDVIDVLEQILATLGGFYPNGQFDSRDPRDYMNAMTASRYSWHWARLEPNGPRTGGTIIGPIVGGCVISDLEQMITEIVSSLAEHLENFDFISWKRLWDSESAVTDGMNH